MRNLFIFLGLALYLFSVNSCRPEKGPLIPTSTVKMNFKVVYDGEPVLFGVQGVPYHNNLEILFDSFKFYCANGSLLGDNKIGETELFEVQFGDFSSIDNVEDAIKGRPFPISKIPVGTYSGIRFDIGVPPGLNNSLPSEYFGNHPLALTENYSAEMNSYFFMNLSGWGDVDQNNVFDDLQFYYLPATNELFQEELLFLKEITVVENEETFIEFTIDLKKILDNGNNAIDVLQTPVLSAGEMVTIGKTLMENLKSAITIDE